MTKTVNTRRGYKNQMKIKLSIKPINKRTDEVLTNKIVNLNIKNQIAVDTTVYEIYAYFKVTS